MRRGGFTSLQCHVNSFICIGHVVAVMGTGADSSATCIYPGWHLDVPFARVRGAVGVLSPLQVEGEIPSIDRPITDCCCCGLMIWIQWHDLWLLIPYPHSSFHSTFPSPYLYSVHCTLYTIPIYIYLYDCSFASGGITVLHAGILGYLKSQYLLLNHTKEQLAAVAILFFEMTMDQDYQAIWRTQAKLTRLLDPIINVLV